MKRVKVTKGREKGRIGWIPTKEDTSCKFVTVLFRTHGPAEQRVLRRENVRILPR